MAVDGGRTEAAPASEPGDPLRRAYERGLAAHGSLDLPFEEYAAEVRRRLGEGDEVSSRRLESDGARDLYLTLACERGCEEAAAVFREEFSSLLLAMARHRGAKGGSGAALAEETLQELFLPPPDGRRRTLLGTFQGRSSLKTWLGVVVGRRLIDRIRREERLESYEGEGGSLPEARTVTSPQARMEADELEAALRGALETLEARERIVLYLSLVEEEKGTEIAELFGLHPSSISNLRTGALEKLRRVSAPFLSPTTERSSVRAALGKILALFRLSREDRSMLEGLEGEGKDR